MDGWVEELVDIRGVYRFSSLVKQNKKAKNCAVFWFAGKRFFFNICEVITWEKRKKALIFTTGVCVYYCRTYYKAVRVGGGG